jgi:hypothetical protein
MMRTLRTLTGSVLLLLVACRSVPCAANGETVNVERHALHLAEANRTRVNKVRLGQTLAEVEKIMGPPERRATRLRYDGLSIEEWSYITDYVRKMDALILFVGGKVEEIQSTPWEDAEPARPATPVGQAFGTPVDMKWGFCRAHSWPARPATPVGQAFGTPVGIGAVSTAQPARPANRP